MIFDLFFYCVIYKTFLSVIRESNDASVRPVPVKTLSKETNRSDNLYLHLKTKMNDSKNFRKIWNFRLPKDAILSILRGKVLR